MEKLALGPLRLSPEAYANSKEKITMGLSWLKRIKKERGSGKLDSSSSAEVDQRKEIRETEEGPLAGSSPLPAPPG